MKPRLYLAPWLVLLGAPMYTGAQVPQGDLGQKAKVEREMVAFDPDYRKSVRAREAEALSLAAQVRANEARGRKTSCSHQLMNETLWMLGHTADFARIDGRLRDLKASIASPERESIADEQDPEDGVGAGVIPNGLSSWTASPDHLLLDPDRTPPQPRSDASPFKIGHHVIGRTSAPW